MYSDSLEPAFSVDGVTAYHGHVLDVLAALPDQCVSTIVTSPPYWGPRNYEGEPTLWGGDPACRHDWSVNRTTPKENNPSRKITLGYGKGVKETDKYSYGHKVEDVLSTTCRLCGAWRGQYGQEPTPEMYVEHSMMVFDELWRVLRDDGVLWWNLGDGSAASGMGWMKPKDLMLIPFAIAQAGRARGWYIRSTIIWDKSNAFPESVKDRPTDSFEYIFMFTKKPRYWYDMDAVREPHARLWDPQTNFRGVFDGTTKYVGVTEDSRTSHRNPPNPLGRNLRAVWRFPTQPYPGGHFAVFPIELPRRCIAASCPPEICLRCGRPRVRVIEAESRPNRSDNRGKHDGSLYRTVSGGVTNDARTRNLVGWSDCGCGAEFVPGIALDPFAGTGTTGLAARELGRDCILIECADAYLEQMYQRLTVGDAAIRQQAKEERAKKVDAISPAERERAIARVGSRSTLGGVNASQVASKAAQIARARGQ